MQGYEGLHFVRLPQHAAGFDYSAHAGVALVYNQLTDDDLAKMPIASLQPEGGLVFVWVINVKMHACLQLFDSWGYT